MPFPSPTIVDFASIPMPIYVGNIGAGSIIAGAGESPTIGSPQFDATHNFFYALTAGHGATTTSPGVLLCKVDACAGVVVATALLPFAPMLNRSIESPVGICVAPDGTVYVSTTIDNVFLNFVFTQLYKYDANLNFISTVSASWDESTTPESSLDASDGSYLYGVDHAGGGQYVVGGGGGIEAIGGGSPSIFIWDRASMTVLAVAWISVNFFFTAIWVDRNGDIWATGYTSNDDVRHLVQITFNGGGITAVNVFSCPVNNDPLAAWYSAVDHSVVLGIPATRYGIGPSADPPFSKIDLATRTVVATLDIPHGGGGSYYMVESGNRWRDQTGTPQMVGVVWVDTSTSPWPASVKAVMVDSDLNMLDVTSACYGVTAVAGSYGPPSFIEFVPNTGFTIDPTATCLIEFTYDNVNQCVWTWQPASEQWVVAGSFTTTAWERFCFLLDAPANQVLIGHGLNLLSAQPVTPTGGGGGGPCR